MSLGSKIENQPFAVRRVVLASGWRQGLTSLFNLYSHAPILGSAFQFIFLFMSNNAVYK